ARSGATRAAARRAAGTRAARSAASGSFGTADPRLELLDPLRVQLAVRAAEPRAQPLGQRLDDFGAECPVRFGRAVALAAQPRAQRLEGLGVEIAAGSALPGPALETPGRTAAR